AERHQAVAVVRAEIELSLETDDIALDLAVKQLAFAGSVGAVRLELPLERLDLIKQFLVFLRSEEDPGDFGDLLGDDEDLPGGKLHAVKRLGRRGFGRRLLGV